MWLLKIKKKKMQFLIITLILFMASAILTACISFAMETEKFDDKYFSSENCPIVFDILSKDNGKELLESDSNVMQYISKIETADAKYNTSGFYHDQKRLQDSGIFVHCVDDRKALGYPLDVVKGEVTNHPGDGEIWICTIYSKAFDLSVGDEITIGKQSEKKIKISAIVNTPECCSGFLDNYPCYMNSKTLHEMDGTDVYAVRIYSKNDSVEIKAINDNLPKEYIQETLTSIERTTFKTCLSILTSIFGGVGISSAIVIFVVSLIVIRYMVRASIVKEYRMIGIYKALGNTEKQVRKIYYNCYMASGIVGLVAGVFAGRPLAILLGNTVLDGIPGFVLTKTTTIVSLCVIVGMGVILAVNVWTELKKISRITPVQALSVGMVSSKEKLCKSVLSNAHSAGTIAINTLFKNKGMTLLTIMILSVSFYLCLFAAASKYTLGNYANEQQVWENLPKYDGYIKIMGDEKVMEYIKQSEDLRDYVQLDFDIDCPQMFFGDTDVTCSVANPMIYENFNEDRYKDVPFTKGRICVNPHEITASMDFLKEVNKKVGDYLEIGIGDKKADFLIVGSYSAKMQGGISFYIQEQDMNELGYSTPLNTVLFFLKDGVTYEEFVKKFDATFTQSMIYDNFDFIEHEGETIGSIAKPICLVVFLAFAAFSILNVINMIYSQNRENRKKYGILKANGFTTAYIRREALIRLSIESGIAVLITVLIHEFVSARIFSLACGMNYICKPVWLTVVVCAGMFAVILLIGALMLIPVKKISPVELMEE